MQQSNLNRTKLWKWVREICGKIKVTNFAERLRSVGSAYRLTTHLNTKETIKQGNLSKGKGSVQLTPLYQLV